MASYPKELAQDAVYQSHTSRLTELWSLPRPTQGLDTNNINNSDYVVSSETVNLVICNSIVYVISFVAWYT